MRYLVLMMMLILLSACASPPLPSSYSTAFDSAEQWTQTASRQADIFIQNGQLHILIKQADVLAWSVAGLTVEDVSIDVEATLIEGPQDNGFGIIARRLDDENLYSFQISSDGYFLIQKRLRGQWRNLSGDWQPSPAIRTGRQTNHLRVVCRGNLFTFSVNGAQLAQVSDESLRRGDVGVIAGALAEPGVHIVFDNVHVNIREGK